MNSILILINEAGQQEQQLYVYMLNIKFQKLQRKFHKLNGNFNIQDHLDYSYPYIMSMGRNLCIHKQNLELNFLCMLSILFYCKLSNSLDIKCIFLLNCHRFHHHHYNIHLDIIKYSYMKCQIKRKTDFLRYQCYLLNRLGIKFQDLIE